MDFPSSGGITKQSIHFAVCNTGEGDCHVNRVQDTSAKRRKKWHGNRGNSITEHAESVSIIANLM